MDNDLKAFVENQISAYQTESHNFGDPLDEPLTVDVSKVCKDLPNGKAGGEDGLIYEHVKHADDAFFTHLTRIFNAMRQIEHIPSSCLWCYTECAATPGKLKSLLGHGGNRTRDLWDTSAELQVKSIDGRN